MSGPSIIIVGPDRVGKTTLVAHLSRLLNLPSFKAPSEKQIFREGGRSSLVFDYTLTHFLKQTGHRFISDRGYPCEWAYSRVFNRETDDDLLERIDMMHGELGTKIVYVYSSKPPTEEDDLVPSEKYWDVHHAYMQFAQWTDVEMHAFDTSAMLDAYASGSDDSLGHAMDLLQDLHLG